MKRSNRQNLWHAWNYDTVRKGQMAKICDMHKITHLFQGQMAKISNMHKITHAFECGTHVNIMGPNKWNSNYELQSTCRWNYKADENEMKQTTHKLKTKHLKVVDIWMHKRWHGWNSKMHEAVTIVVNFLLTQMTFIPCRWKL